MAMMKPIRVDVEVKATGFAKLMLVLPVVGSFAVSLALAVALIGMTYCAVIEVQHVHRSIVHE